MPTSSMNLSRLRISLMTIVEISSSFFVSFNEPRKSNASAIESDVKSTMFLPKPFSLPPMYTRSASGRRRAPLQTGHGSVPKKYFVPSPLHSGQAPYGELNEKSRGSTSGDE